LTPGQEGALSVKEVAFDLFCLTCISEEGVGRAKDTIRKYSDLVYHDLRNVSALDAAVSEEIMEYSRNA
jgi:hypothetical protein